MMAFTKGLSTIGLNTKLIRFCNYFPKLNFTSNNANVEDLEIPDYETYEYNKIAHKTRTIAKLIELFNCSQDDAKAVIRKAPKLVKRSVSNINETVSLLEQKYVKREILYEYPWVLAIKNGKHLYILLLSWSYVQFIK